MARFVGAAATVTLLLVLAACGGGSSNTDSAGKTSTGEPSATASETSGGAGAWTSAQCTELAMSMAAAAGGVGPQNGSTDLSSVSDFLRSAADGAPEDLRADLITLADGMQKFYDTLEAAGIDFSDPNTYSSQAAATTLSEAADQLQKDVGDASERIQTRMTELCGS